MSKSILMSIQPKWVCEILNGRKTIEVRRKFPKDYVGWVYIYCTKNKPYLYGKNMEHYKLACLQTDNEKEETTITEPYWTTTNHCMGINSLNGKVVARFWCDKVEEHRPFFHWCIDKETCLTRHDVLDYLDSKDKFVGNPKRQGKVYAIHISKLEIFDRPRELCEFRTHFTNKIKYVEKEVRKQTFITYRQKNRNHILTKAPQNYCYIESEN